MTTPTDAKRREGRALTKALALIVLLFASPASSEDRRYTVTEIDKLRSACEERWLFGTTYNGDNCRRCGRVEDGLETRRYLCAECFALCWPSPSPGAGGEER